MYEEIFEAWKREKNSEILQSLPTDFLEKASEYLTNLKLTVNREGKEDSLDIARKRETEYTEFMLWGLLRMRARKIASLSLEDLVNTPANLLDKEMSLFEDLRVDLGKYMRPGTQTPRDVERDTRAASEKLADAATEVESNTMLLRILQPMPKLVGVDLEEYGPFQQEDLVVLPKENALVLIARGVASEVKTAKIQ